MAEALVYRDNGMGYRNEMDYIFIEELMLPAKVGIYPREKVASQTVELNVKFGIPDAACTRDHIADTIDYAEIVTRIRSELADRHFNLIESIGERIAEVLLHDYAAPWVDVRVAKVGVIRDARRVGVEIRRIAATARAGKE